MSFKRSNIINISGDVSNLPRTFQYVLDEDTASDTVTTKSYFPKDDVFKPGDRIDVVAITKSSGLVTDRTDTAYVLADDENGELTATAMS